jgi:hypothetical protein
MIYATRSRWILATVLAVLGAFWFEVDFSSSHPAASDAAIVAAEASRRHPLPTLSEIGGVLTGGIVTSLPPWGVLAVAAAYVLGRVAFARGRLRR